MKTPAKLKGIRNITISGRIGTGKTTLARHLADALGWYSLNGGQIIRMQTKELGASIVETSKRPDELDLSLEEKIKEILTKESNHVVQAHLAGYDAQGIEGVYKILLVCKNNDGEDKKSVRIERLVEREGMSQDAAKREVIEREEQNLAKYRRLYVENDANWVYWDEKYYDLVVNTYYLNEEEALGMVLEKIGFYPSK